jgi:hypothetical protein
VPHSSLFLACPLVVLFLQQEQPRGQDKMKMDIFAGVNVFVGVNEGVVQIVELISQSILLQLILGTITVGVVVRLIRR